MINVLHIVPDDKFIDFVIYDFDKYSELNNRYVLLNDIKTEVFAYIKDSIKIEVIILKSKDYEQLINNNEIDLIILHSFAIEWVKQFLKDLNISPIIYWISWGWDYVDLLNLKLYKPKTVDFFNKIFQVEEPKRKKNTLLKNPLTRILKKKSIYYLKYPQRRRENAIITSLYKKIDFCSCVMPTEFSYLKRIPGLKAIYLPYKIGYINNPFININEIEPIGDGILIGNSYTLTNNHLDVFYQLSGMKVEKEIIVPLSYGLNPSKYPELIAIGKELFGNKFFPIIAYLPFHEYNKLLKKSRIAIFNSIRQQAVGNILIMLWQGAKVFLSVQSPVYKYFKQIGIVLFTVENDLTIENISGVLNTETIKHNRKKVFEYYSKEAIDQNNAITIQNLIMKVQNKQLKSLSHDCLL